MRVDVRTNLLELLDTGRELLDRLAANVRAEVLVDALLAERVQDSELHRLRHERDARIEVEDVVAGQQLQERAPLRQLLAREPALPVERDVRLRMERVAVEDEQIGLDAATAQRLRVLPWDPGGVHRAVQDPHVRSIRFSASCRQRSSRSASSWDAIVSRIVA